MVKGQTYQQNNYPLIVFSLFAMWFALRGYDGFIHDARLYVFQAIAFNNEELRKTELLTKYFNQGDLSLFSFVHFVFIKVFGKIIGSFILYITSQCIYFLSFFLLLKNLFNNHKYIVLAFLSLITIDLGYLTGVFRINETFLTSRILAEAFSILAFVGVLSNKYKHCLFYGFISLLIHPLIGIWFFIIGFNYWLLQKFNVTKWILIHCLVAFFLIITTWFFNHPMADDWYDYIYQTKKYLFPSQWSSIVWDRYLHQLLICIFAYFYIKPKKLKRIILILVCTSISCLLINYVGEEIKSQFLIKLQFWRVNYLLFISAIIFSSYYAVKNFCKDERFLFVMLLVFSWIIRDYGGAIIFLLFVFLNFISIKHSFYIDRLSCQFRKLSYVFFTLAIFPYFVDIQYFITNDLFELDYFFQSVNNAGNEILFVISLIVYFVFPKKRRFLYILPVISTLLIVSHYTKYEDVFSFEKQELGNQLSMHIRDNETIFWQDRELEVLIYAEKSHYFSGTQLVPVVFSEKLYTDGKERYEKLIASGMQSFFSDQYHRYIQEKENGLNKNKNKKVDYEKICKAPNLDYLVLKKDKKKSVGIYDFKYKNVDWVLHSCSDL